MEIALEIVREVTVVLGDVRCITDSNSKPGHMRYSMRCNMETALEIAREVLT